MIDKPFNINYFCFFIVISEIDVFTIAFNLIYDRQTFQYKLLLIKINMLTVNLSLSTTICSHLQFFCKSL